MEVSTASVAEAWRGPIAAAETCMGLICHHRKDMDVPRHCRRRVLDGTEHCRRRQGLDIPCYAAGESSMGLITAVLPRSLYDDGFELRDFDDKEDEHDTERNILTEIGDVPKSPVSEESDLRSDMHGISVEDGHGMDAEYLMGLVPPPSVCMATAPDGTT